MGSIRVLTGACGYTTTTNTWPATSWAAGALILMVASAPLWMMGHALPDTLEEYCEQDTFDANCPDNEVVLMEYARYGRMQLGAKCLGTEFGKGGCYNDVIELMDSWCSGRQACSVGVRDLPVVIARQECPTELRGYLEAQYTCVPVSQPLGGCCTTSPYARIPASGKFIGSIVTKETGCGSIDCPWVIEALPGQTINITLMDFDLAHTRRNVYPEESPSTVCHVYAIIKESEPMQSSETICAGKRRQVHAYKSQSHAVEVRIVQNVKQKQRQAHFLLSYNVLGCPNPAVPSYGFVDRVSPLKAVIGCNGDDQTRWEMTCLGNQWIGSHGNCTDAGAAGVSGVLEDILSIPPDMSILIVVMIALAIAFIILIIGVVYLKRRWTRQDSPHGSARGYIETQNMSNQQRNPQKSPKPPGGPGDHPSHPPPAEHSYFQTWEIHRPAVKPPGPHQGMHVPRESYNRTGPGTMDASNNSSTMGRYVDHVYEDPAFDRKEVGMGIEGHGSSQYYELEPDSEGVRRSLPPLQRNGKAVLVKERSPKQRCSFPGTTVDTHGIKSGPGSLTS